MAKTKVIICPYCGASQPAEDFCRSCGGLYDDLSRQATHNDMGPWFIRSVKRPHQPGCSYETLVRLLERGQIDRYTIIRGPTTKQFWTVARRVPGVSHLLGYCHNCDAKVSADDHGCPSCGVPFGAYLDRNHLGLPEVNPLPWDPGLDMETRAGAAAGAGAGPVPAASHTWPSAGDSRGISSFASDSEIVGNGQGQAGAGSAATPHAPEPRGAGPALHSPQRTFGGGAAATATTAADRATLAETQANRALRREIARQRRMITMLAIIMVIALFVIVIFAVRLSADNRSAASPGDSKAGAPTGAPQTTVPAPSTAKPADEGGQAIDGGPIDTLHDPGVEPEVVDAATLHEQAVLLMAQAGDETLALADRIKACEDALAKVRAIPDAPGAAALDVDLEVLRGQIERELERLKLREFFPTED
jgi:hypothetical protein